MTRIGQDVIQHHARPSSGRAGLEPARFFYQKNVILLLAFTTMFVKKVSTKLGETMPPQAIPRQMGDLRVELNVISSGIRYSDFFIFFLIRERKA